MDVWKSYARWVPQQLTEEQSRGREWCFHVRRNFDANRSERVWDIVKGNEIFVYEYDPETKQQSSVWLFSGESPSMKFKISRSTSNQMIAVFFTKSGHVTSTPLWNRKTVNAEWYINIWLPKVFKAWTARCPNKQSRNGELRTQKWVLPVKPGVGQYIAIHGKLPAWNFFPANIYPSGPYTSIFPKALWSLSCVGCG